jgi:hypothetical protein
MDFSNTLADSFWVVPLVVAIVQVFKMTGISGKWSPLISLAVGIGLGFLVSEDHTLQHILLSGVIYGLSASGLYSGVQSTQKVSQVKSGQIPLDQADTSQLTKEEILEIQKQQQEKQQVQQKETVKKESTIIKP